MKERKQKIKIVTEKYARNFYHVYVSRYIEYIEFVSLKDMVIVVHSSMCLF